MTDIARKATLLAIFLYPLDGFKFSFFPSMSLYRVALIFALSAGILSCCAQKGKIKVCSHIAIPFIMTAIVSTILSNFISTEPAYASSAMLNELSGVMMIFLIVTLFRFNDTDILLKQFVRSAYIGIPFAVLSWGFIFQNPAEIESICSFGGLFNFEITAELTASAYNMRLVLPYSSSSVYSGVLAMTIAILICDKTMYKNATRNVLIIIFTLLLIMTQARTGMLALAVFIFIYILKMSDHKRKSKMILLCGVAMLCIVLFIGSDEDFVRKLLSRFNGNNTNTSIFEDRHFLLPLEGILIWISSAKSFLFGIGYGSCIDFSGKWTDIPYFFFNSYITQIVAKGLLGVAIIGMWLLAKLLLGALFKNRDNYSPKMKANAAFTVLLIACLTYEFYPYYCFFIIFGIVLLNIGAGRKAISLNE